MRLLIALMLSLLAVTAKADGIFNLGAPGSPTTCTNCLTSLNAGTTPTTGFTNGHVMGSNAGKLVDTGLAYAGLGTITASSTVASGFTSGNIIGVTSGTVVDTGVAFTNLNKIVAGTTVTQGFTSGNLIGTSGGVAIDSTIPINTVGTVTSISAGCGSSTGTGAITTAGTLVTLEPITTLTATDAPILASYCGTLINFSNASNRVPPIAVAGSTGFPAGWYADICNIGAGTQTITPATGTIGGAATYVVAAGSAAAPTCLKIVSDGTSNYVIKK